MIKELLIGKTEKEKSSIKIEQHFLNMNSKLKGIKKRYSFIDNLGRNIEIEAVGKGVIVNGKIIKLKKGIVEPLWIKANVNGKYLNGDGWYGFINPPIMVPDGTKTTFIENDIEIQKDNFKEDLEESIKQMLLEVIK